VIRASSLRLSGLTSGSSKRPIVYIALPSLALILCLILANRYSLPQALAQEAESRMVGRQPAASTANSLAAVPSSGSPVAFTLPLLSRKMQSPTAHDWYIETVDTSGGVYGVNSLALDESGQPHISYYDIASGTLRYAAYAGTTWQIETVDNTGNVGAYVAYSALALDKLGHPHISYYNLASGDLKYATYTGTAWQIETVDSAGDVGRYTSLALDGADHPHITYYDWIGRHLKYAEYDGVTWQIETVPVLAEGNNSLALDESGRPHISFFGGTNLGYTWREGALWHVEIVQAGGLLCERGNESSIALDTTGQPHIAYRGAFYCGLVSYAWYTGSAWQIEQVPTFGGDVGDSVSLKLDEFDRPHVSFYEGANAQDLKHAWHNDTGWHLETVDSEGDVGLYASLALDKDGRPHVSYLDRTNKNLKYAQSLPPLFLQKQATPPEGVRVGDSLTYTLVLSGPAHSVYLLDSLTSAVHYVTDSITSTVLPLPVYSSTISAVVWEGALPTDTVQTISFQVVPDITGTESLSLSSPIANTAWLIDTKYDKSVSAMVIVNGLHVYMPLILRQSP
jgi:hypothetical protein